MKFVVLLMLVGEPDPAQAQSLERPEADRVWELYEAGTLEEIHLLNDQSGAVLVMRGEGPAIEAAVRSLPMVREGVLEPRYLGLVPWPEMTRMLDERGLPKPDWWAVRAASN